MSFQFRLRSILKLRERDRDKASQSFQQAQLARQKLLDQIAEIEAESQQISQLRGTNSVGQMDVRQILDAQRYQMNLLETVRGIQINIAAIEQEIERRRAKLVECERGVKVLEKLQDKQREAWNADQAARAQSRLDEWASFQHFQKNSGA